MLRVGARRSLSSAQPSGVPPQPAPEGLLAGLSRFISSIVSVFAIVYGGIK